MKEWYRIPTEDNPLGIKKHKETTECIYTTPKCINGLECEKYTNPLSCKAYKEIQSCIRTRASETKGQRTL